MEFDFDVAPTLGEECGESCVAWKKSSRRRSVAEGLKVGSWQKHFAMSDSSAGESLYWSMGGGVFAETTWRRSCGMDLNCRTFQGAWPEAICRRRPPYDQMSDLRPYLSPFITSGAMKYGVPHNVLPPPAAVEPASTIEVPKSANFATPVSLTKTLPPLISRCIIRFRCRYPKPLATSVA